MRVTFPGGQQPAAATRTGWPWTTAGSAPLPDRMPDGGPWPRISIVTPSLNQGRFLEHALRSVLAQGYPDLELVVMDGGSNDDSAAILAHYAGQLTHWESAPDDGPPDALNRGFSHATGDILAFINADDFYLPDCFARVALALRARPDVDVISGHGYFSDTSGALGAPVFSDPWDLTRFQYGTCLLLQQSTFFRRAAFQRVRGFRRDSRTTWDMELWADMAEAGANFGTVNEFLAAFRLHPESITGATRWRARRNRDAHAVLERLRGRPESAGDRLRTLVYRTARFAAHPLRSARQRLYFHSTLGRWSL